MSGYEIPTPKDYYDNGFKAGRLAGLEEAVEICKPYCRPQKNGIVTYTALVITRVIRKAMKVEK